MALERRYAVSLLAILVIAAQFLASPAFSVDLPDVALDPFDHTFSIERRLCAGDEACDQIAQSSANAPGFRTASFDEVVDYLPQRLGHAGAFPNPCFMPPGEVGWPARWVRCFDVTDTNRLDYLTQGMAGLDEWRTSKTPGSGGRYLIATWCDRRVATGLFGYVFYGASLFRACSSETERRTQISLISLDRNAYRHVLLKEPYMDGGQARLRNIGLHAGGAGVAGEWLYVADTNWLYVFNLNFFIQEPSGAYVLPVWERWIMPKPDRDRYNPFSSLSIDGSSIVPTLVASEFKDSESAESLVTVWPLTVSGRLRSPISEPDVVLSLAAYQIDGDSIINKVQGVASANDIYLFSETDDEIERTPAGKPRLSRDKCISWGIGVPEDLYASRAEDIVVGINEQPRVRAFWAVDYDHAFGLGEPPGYPRRDCND